MKWYNLFNPCAYLRKIRQIKQALEDKRFSHIYDKDAVAQLQRETFQSLGFDYDEAEHRVQNVLSRSPELSHISPGSMTTMCSEHWTAFAALDSSKIARVLELGTYNGESARFLSLLFPQAEIVTLDLPDESSAFANSYGRSCDEYRKEFIAHRTAMLERENICYVQANSFHLPALGLGLFDFIWVDAGHYYPEVSWDVCNAWHSCRDGGWIFFDDVYLSDAPVLAGADSIAPRDTLKALESCGICSVAYIFKRLSAEASANPRRRKYVAITKKNSHK